MKKRMLSYRKKVEAALSDGGPVDWERMREEFLVRISFFQHERAMHLAVTALFGLIEVLATALFLNNYSPYVCAFGLAVLLLLVPYVFHYYSLENELHRLYSLYDRIAEKR
jgi:uncharacterized membrane protein YphA (DoxX/SURF4 family)